MLTRWEPFNEMYSLQKQINRLFNDLALPEDNDRATFHKCMPSVDIVEKEKEFIVKAEIPGMEQKDIELSLDGKELIIKGEKKFEKEEKKDNYLRKEISYGTFYRAFTIGSPIKEEEVKANYKNGILEIILPKAEKALPGKIKIE